MTILKTGVVGAGKVAPTHAFALQTLPESQFAGICSRSLDSARTLAAQYHVPAYRNVEEMIIKGGVQAVLITTPHPAHAGPALQAMALGAHVMVEKPLAEPCDIPFLLHRRMLNEQANL